MSLKLILFALLVSIHSIKPHAFRAQTAGGAEIKFDKAVHSLGILNKGDRCEYGFKFTNTGTAPLIISNATTTCGCDMASYPKNPILPGDSATIHYKYDSYRIGPFMKTLTVISNAGNSIITLTVCGLVRDPESTSKDLSIHDSYCKCLNENK